MSANDILEMDSSSETEGMDRDIELVMINEEVGKKIAFVCRKRNAVSLCIFVHVRRQSGVDPSLLRDYFSSWNIDKPFWFLLSCFKQLPTKWKYFYNIQFTTLIVLSESETNTFYPSYLQHCPFILIDFVWVAQP